jgi:hypothetical protein
MCSKIFRIILTALVLLNFSVAFAQDYSETALLFSRTRPGGSARIQGLGGAQVALGGDYSSGLSNPAGLGMFNRSEFTFSPALTSNTTLTNYFGNRTDDNRTVFNIPGLSLVWHMPKEDGAFLGGSFAITFNRVNDFNRSTLYSAGNDQNSVVDYFIDQAFGETTDQFRIIEDQNGNEVVGRHYNTPTGLAYHNYLIGPWSSHPNGGPDDQYFTDVGYPQTQQEETLVKGASNQWTFSYGANIEDKFFFGGGVGVASIRYKSQKIFSELYDNPDTIQSMVLNENLEVRGSGVNLTLGAIVRPADFIQVGISYVTPTFYSFTETYEASMNSDWSNFDYHGIEIVNHESASTDLVTSDYNLTTPSKFSAGVALLSKFGFLTGDIELTNYAKTKYTSDTPGISYVPENQDIRELFRSVLNYRIGAEYRFDIYRIRVGYGNQGNTYQGVLGPGNKIISLSAGAGIRTKTFYIDFALVHRRSNWYPYQPYTFFDGSGPVVNLKDHSMTGMITVGFPF